MDICRKWSYTKKNTFQSGNIKKEKNKIDEIVNIALIGIGLALGICTIVTSILGQVDFKNTIIMLGIGISCLAIYLLKNNK